MTSKETVLRKYPDALVQCVQPEAHAAEAYERRLHWAVYDGPCEDARLLGVSLTEESAWRVVADVLAEVELKREQGSKVRGLLTR